MLKGLFTSLATSLQTAADGIDTLANKDKKDIVKVIRAQVDTTINNATILINNSLKEENREKIAKDISTGISNVFTLTGKISGKVAHSVAKRIDQVKDGFETEFDKPNK
jgi:hypothetical protein